MLNNGFKVLIFIQIVHDVEPWYLTTVFWGTLNENTNLGQNTILQT